MSQQFSTFDTLADRKDVVYLFERLGADLPEAMARDVRADFLRMIVRMSTNGFAENAIIIDPDQCQAVKAYTTFVHIIGVLFVPMDDAVAILEEIVRDKLWASKHWKVMCGEMVEDAVLN